MSSTSLLNPNAKAIVVFTHGKDLKIKRDGSGSTGNWVIDPKRPIHKVVIYERTPTGNEIYVAKPAAIARSRDEGRFVIKLADVKYFGSTYFNWPDFAGSRNPVRYRQKYATRGGERRVRARMDFEQAQLF